SRLCLTITRRLRCRQADSRCERRIPRQSLAERGAFTLSWRSHILTAKGCSPMATAEALLTAEEYLLLPDDGQPSELVRGRLVTMNMPAPRRGQICAKIARFLGNFADQHDAGHVLTNDSGVVTERDPDTVRGAAVAFYGYDQVPRGPLPR